MAKLQLILASSPRLLLERAADEFLAPPARGSGSRHHTPACWLALRQGGLRDDLLSLAAERGVSGWFDPPLCVFAQLPERLAGPLPRPLEDYERAVLITRILCETATRVVARGGRTNFAEAVDRWFGELVAEDVSAEELGTALARLADRDAFQELRDADLAEAYQQYLSQTGTDRLDPRARWTHVARIVRSDPQGVAQRLGGRRGLRIVGLQDLRGGWRGLLDALRNSPALDHVAIYTSVPLHEAEGLRPDETVVLDEPPSLAARLFEARTDPAAGSPIVTLLSAPDVNREVEHVAVRIRELIDAGTPPHRIAVVTRASRPYAGLIERSLERTGITPTLRKRAAFVEIPVVRSILSLLAVARDGWSRHGLVELAQQPYLGLHIDAGLINYIGYRRRVEGLEGWEGALELLLREAVAAERQAGSDEKRDSWTGRTPPPERVTRGLAAFRTFVGMAAPLDQRRTLREWLDWLDAEILGAGWGIENRLYRVKSDQWEIVRLDTAGLRGIRAILSQWRTALDQWGGGEETLDAGEAESRLREMFSGDVALWSPVRRSVQILEGLAAAQRSFDHVFVVGVAASSFPLTQPLSPFYDNDERTLLRAAGLPVETRAEWDRRERELFRSLVAAAGQTLTVSCPRLGAQSDERLPSVFFEELEEVTGQTVVNVPVIEVRTPGVPLMTSAEVVPYAAHAASIERMRGSGSLSAWNGRIEAADLRQQLAERLGETRLWSATQLESFAKCPWSFFSARLLYLEKFEDPDIDIDPRVRGTLLHDALRRFFDNARQRVGGPVFLRNSDLLWALPMAAESLANALAESDAELWLGQPALRETKRAELQRMLARYLAKEVETNESQHNKKAWQKTRILRTAADAHEMAFDNVELNLGGESILLRGTIDRIEVGIDDRVPSSSWIAAVDYKTSKWSAPGGGESAAWEDGVVLQVPLYARVLTQLRPGSRVARVEYRAIRTGERVHPLELVRVTKEGNAHRLEPHVEDQARMDAALDAVGAHVRLARGGEFPARPAPSCMCPGFCHAWEICRVAGGPREKW
jgi:RecB family exonuclease